MPVKSPTVRERVLAALADQDMTPEDLATACDCAYRTLYNGTLMRMKSACAIHVCAWIRAAEHGGRPQPIYRLGAGEDAPRPVPLPSTVKSMAWRKEHPERYRKSRAKWDRKNRKRINKHNRINKARREGTPIVEVIDPILAALLRPVTQKAEVE